MIFRKPPWQTNLTETVKHLPRQVTRPQRQFTIVMVDAIRPVTKSRHGQPSDGDCFQPSGVLFNGQQPVHDFQEMRDIERLVQPAIGST